MPRYSDGAWIFGSTEVLTEEVVREVVRHLMVFADLLVIEDRTDPDTLFTRGFRRGVRTDEPGFINGYHAVFGGRFVDFNTMVTILKTRKKRFSLYDRDTVLLGTFDPHMIDL